VHASFDGRMPLSGSGQPAMFSYVYLVIMSSCCCICISYHVCYLFGEIKFLLLHLQVEDRGPWHQTAKIMTRPTKVKISSFQPSEAPLDYSATSSASRCPHCSRRQPAKDAGEAASSTQEEPSTLDRLLAEMYRYCDRDCGPGETASQLKAKLKRAILDKYCHK